jgi:predicted metal-dependent phosphoesterase TrpH
VRLTEFWRRMNERFGRGYAESLAHDYRLPGLGATIEDALAAGVDAKEVWRAVCAEFEMPSSLI